MGMEVALKVDVRAKEYVSMGTRDIGRWTRLVGGTCVLLPCLAPHFLFSNAILLITFHFGSGKSLPCLPVSCDLLPGYEEE